MVWAILVTIFTGQKYGKKVGFCGQGVANSEVLRGVVAISGITSASVVPDTYYRTKQDFAAIEAQNLSAADLGRWLAEQHQAKLVKLLEANGRADAAKLAGDPKKIRAWYDAEAARLHAELRKPRKRRSQGLEALPGHVPQARHLRGVELERHR